MRRNLQKSNEMPDAQIRLQSSWCKMLLGREQKQELLQMKTEAPDEFTIAKQGLLCAL
jgi:hypothetical protein